MKKQSFLQGALILMIAGLINRVIGFVLRLILVRQIGDEGLGLFQMVYPLFMTLLLLTTAGFPVAISKLIPERMTHNDKQGGYNLLKVTLVFVCLMSILISLILYFSSGYIAQHIYRDSRTGIILLSLIPALLISPLAACFRNFFHGIHSMLPTAFSQITEQFTRLIITLSLVSTAASLGLKYQTASMAVGISAGEFAGLLILLIMFIHHLFLSDYQKLSHSDKIKKIQKKFKHNFFFDLKTIAALAIPITIGRLVNSLMMSGEAILIPRQLQLAGFSIQEATSLYGQLSGMVEQLIFLPTVITIALTTSLIPNISAARACKNYHKIKENYQDVIRITTYLGFPVTVIFLCKGSEICQLLFGYPAAGVILSHMAFSATFIYFLQVSHGMLNGLGKPQLSLLNLTLGSILKIGGILLLTRQTALGIHGAAFSIGLGYMLSALLNFIVIGHNIGYSLNIKQCFIKPLLASLLICFIEPYISSYSKKIISVSWVDLLVILILILVYAIFMGLIKAVTPEDTRRFKK
ncbi:MAG: polysaccharide biosynthesis protein [Firmicutes bacterium]|nr:polysaccharide biosynthesis protein [Bacillota bacterium]